MECRQGAKDLRTIKDLRPCIEPVLCRPFDLETIFYHKAVVFSSAYPVMHHLLGRKNLAIVVTRQTKDKWDVQCSRNLVGHEFPGGV